MDLVRELKEVRFELALRGYDCEAVDAFLAKLRGDLVTVQEQNEDAKARVAELEGKIREGGGSSETEGTLRRTLVLAQRLADETEADSKRIAAELIEGATAEAEQMRTSADVEARGMREAAQIELVAARDEAESIRVTTSEEAAKNRVEARVQAEAILTEAEQRGVDRVAVIEQTAQDEALAMREPVRAEVTELETVRTNLLNDISGLESHLEEQRVRVRTAVEALRVGMSGSIQDLERVAKDDDLLATEPGPGYSGAGGNDVAVAPDIEIMDRVVEAVPPASSIDEVEDAAIQGAADEAIDGDDDVVGSLGGEFAQVVAEEETREEAGDDDGPIDGIFATHEEIFAETALVVDEPVLDEYEESADEGTVEVDTLDEDTLDEDRLVDFAGDVFEDVTPDNFTPNDLEVDAGPSTERIPVVATEADYDDNDLVVLDEEPTALFGTAFGSDAEVASVEEDVDIAAEGLEVGASFVDRFAEALDGLPIANHS